MGSLVAQHCLVCMQLITDPCRFCENNHVCMTRLGQRCPMYRLPKYRWTRSGTTAKLANVIMLWTYSVFILEKRMPKTKLAIVYAISSHESACPYNPRAIAGDSKYFILNTYYT